RGGKRRHPQDVTLLKGLPYGDEKLSSKCDSGDVGQIFSSHLQDINQFLGGKQNRQLPKLGQISWNKLVVVEGDRIDGVLKNVTNQAPPDV
ncbi:LOW QUALITY PROTEIN: calcium/calmodulin-dependent protein kinase II inhibitor 1, partial [Carlito syrichta]|uniref:LOW QUALITY PROTEIN: calcium/calmodulin-dependent protein kinase II inhibitor 1 n=1 Tax=Carlito syrichta TaxID=1868482 RepID=A0A3Q0DVV6_CARSF